MKTKIGFTKKQLIHILKVMVFIGASGALASIIALVSNNPEAVGGIVIAGGINAAAVALQQFLKAPED